jgi:TfoX/Sxy family transcriptional regulator of competence genes
MSMRADASRQRLALGWRAVAWKKTPPDVAAAFEKARPKDPRVEARKMFGFPAIFVNGNLVGGTFEDRIMVRLPEDEIERLIKAKKASAFEPMPGRAMKGYVGVPADATRDAKKLGPWLDRALAHTLTVGPKAGAKKKKKTTAAKRAR